MRQQQRMPLSETEYSRYARHLRLQGFGESAQLKLKAARVLVIGAGGLGSPILLYLAAAGVGTIGIIDDDTVELSNLQRQILFNSNNLGTPKSITAAEALRAINPLIEVITYTYKLSTANAINIFSGYDVIADGSDNFPTRYLANDAAVLTGKPLVYGSVFRFEGQVSVFNYVDRNGERGPNYRDLFPVPPPPGSVPDCNEAGVLGVLPGIIGSMQALEILKIIAGIGTILSGRIFHFDALSQQSQTFMLNRNKDNPLNGDHPAINALIDYDVFCSGGVAINQLSPAQLEQMMVNGEAFDLIDVRTATEYNEINIGATLMPLEDILAGELRVNPDRIQVLHCKSGSRSTRAIRHLMSEANANNLNLYNLQGGLDAYLDYKQSQ